MCKNAYIFNNNVVKHDITRFLKFIVYNLYMYLYSYELSILIKC